MGTAITKQQQFQTLRGLLEKSKSQMEMALPRHVSPDRMLRVVLTTIQRTPKLLECSPKSVIGAVMEAAQLGLMPDGILGHAYLVPFKGVCQLIPGYKGLIDLARRSGHVESLQARCVFNGDEFEFAYGLKPHLTHKPCDDPGELTHVYAIAVLTGGEISFEVMTRAAVDKIRKRSKASTQGPWVTDYDEMARKTVTRKLVKYLPLSVEINQAVALDERAEVGLDQGLGEYIDVGEAEAVEDERWEDEAPEGGSDLDKLVEEELPVAQVEKVAPRGGLFEGQE